MIVMSASFWYVILDEQPSEVFSIFTVGFRFVFGSGHSVKSYASHFPIKIYLYSLFFFFLKRFLKELIFFLPMLNL